MSYGYGGGGGGGAAPAIVAGGLIRWSGDGSVGQTYYATPPALASGSWTYQWFREALASPKARTPIAGATAASYVSAGADQGFRLGYTATNGAARCEGLALAVVLAAPLLLESFNDFPTGWTLSGAGSGSADPSRRVQGTAAAKLTRTPTFSNYTKSNIGTYDPTTLGTLVVHADAGSDPELSQLGANLAGVSLGQSASYTGSISDGSSEGATGQNNYRLDGFWTAMHYSESAPISGYSAALPIGVRAGPFLGGNSPQNGITWIDGLYARAGGRPTVILGFDDIPANQFATIKPLLDARGMKGTFYVPTALIGTALKMTDAQLLQLAAEGHDLQIDGTSTDVAMTTLADVDAVIADLRAQQAWFAARGLPVPEHLCYPNGLSRVEGTRIALGGVSFTNAANTCEVSSAAGIVAGMKVTSSALPNEPPVRVVSVSGTTVTLSANATATVSVAATFVADAGAFHTGKLPAGLARAGIRSARTTVGGSWYTRFGPSGRALIHPGQTTSLQSYAQMKTPLDLAVLRGTTLEYYIHSATAAPVGTEVSVAELTALLDDLAARRDAGTIDLLTKAQWWQRDGAARCPA